MTLTALARDAILAAAGLAALYAVTMTAARIEPVGSWREPGVVATDAAGITAGRGLRADATPRPTPDAPAAATAARARN